MHSIVEASPLPHPYQPVWIKTITPERMSGSDIPVVHVTAPSALRNGIEAGLLEHGVTVLASEAGERKADRGNLHQPTCTVIDIDLHQGDLSVLGTIVVRDSPPVILVGTCPDPRFPVKAVKSGAFDFFPKPLDFPELCAAIVAAMDSDRRQISKRIEERELRNRMASLTPREREVLPLVVGGLLNKQAAALLDISEVTLQIHRGQVMRKMQATSLADLVRMCIRLRVRHWRPAA